jgi:hypothetical protein
MSWFTTGHGIADEVYRSRIDMAQVRNVGSVVVNGGSGTVGIKLPAGGQRREQEAGQWVEHEQQIVIASTDASYYWEGST